MRLTRTQIGVLRKMADGTVLHTMTGLNPRAFLSRNLETVLLATVRKLETTWMIENIEAPEKRWRGSRFRITERGLKVLRDMKEVES